MSRIPLATLALALAAAPAGAIVVDSTADSVVVDGDCTLREAINNVNAGADTTGGDCATGSTITFDPSTDGEPIVLTGAAGDDLNLSGDLDVAADVTITGNGPALTLVSGGGVDRVFDLKSAAASITIEQLEIRDGAISGNGAGVRCNAAVNTLRDCRIVGNTSGGVGGGVGHGGNSNRQIYVERCEILGNTAVDGGGIGTHGSGADMILEVVDSVLGGNTAADEGGGIFRSAPNGTTRVIRTLIRDNMALAVSTTNGGGGIAHRSSSGTLEITDSEIRGNTAPDTIGGGLALNGTSSIVTVVGTTVSGNSAGENGGGVNARSGIVHRFVNTTVSGNSSDAGGGGFWIERDGLVTRLANVTVSGNVADADGDGSGDGGGVGLERGELRLGNSILGANFDGGGEAPDCDPAGLPIESLGYNLIQNAADCDLFGATATDVLGLAPGLGPLADHGGPSPTHLPLAASPAVDGGNPAGCGNPVGGTLLVDQRGEPRPLDGDGDGDARCDVGAVERAAGADLSVTVTDKQTSAVPGEGVTYIVTVANAGPGAAVGAAVTDDFPAGLTCTWTCVGVGGATCTAGPVSGDIDDTAGLPAGSAAGYAAACAIDPGRTGTLTNTATISASGAIDPVPANNSATDFTLLTPVADLAITKDDGVTTAAPGDVLTYTIEVSNPGPSDALAAAVEDVFPPELIGCEWSCAPAGGALCTGGPVAGDLIDSADLFAGSSATYTATCTVDPGANFGALSNTATVAAPAGVTDPDLTDNAATDVDLGTAMIFADGFESGDTTAWSSTVP